MNGLTSMTRLNRLIQCLLPATVLLSLMGCALNPDDGTGAVDTAGAGGMGAATATSSGVARTLALSLLTTDQAVALCDWTNMKQGGYGRNVPCTDRHEATGVTTSSCVDQTLALGNKCADMTVGNIEDCANATGTDLCKLETETACLAVTMCGQ